MRGKFCGQRIFLRPFGCASMRPAQIAREIVVQHGNGSRHGKASMRPAQIAREIDQRPEHAAQVRQASMRPAQIAREIRPFRQCFAVHSGASMRPAQIAREIDGRAALVVEVDPASMRPAQIAREIARENDSLLSRLGRFNEARANCAGNYVAVRMLGLPMMVLQ